MTTAGRTNLDGGTDEVVEAEELAAQARVSDDGGLSAASNAVDSHNSIDTSVVPSINVVRRGIRSLLIAWEGVEAVHGHGYYEAQIDTDPAFGTPDDFYKGKATFTIFDGLTTGVTYYARVRAVDAGGSTGDWSTSSGAQNSDETQTNDIADFAVKTAKIDNAAITVAKIGTLTAGDVVVGINASDATGVIRSNGFVAGSSGWRIRGNGDAEFNDVTIRGDLLTSGTSSGGNVYGLNIIDGYIQTQFNGADSGYVVASSAAIGLYSRAYNPATFDRNDASYVQVEDGRVIVKGEDEGGTGNHSTITLSDTSGRWDSTEPITLDTASSVNLHPGLYLNVQAGSGARFYVGGTLLYEFLSTRCDIDVDTTITGDLTLSNVGRAQLEFYTSSNRIEFDASLDQIQMHISGVQELTLGTAGLVVPNVNADFTGTGDDPVLVDSSGQLHVDTSSARFKDDIRAVPDVLPPITELEPKAYRKDGVDHLGLIAEDIAELWPQVATYESDGTVRNYRDRGVLALLVREVRDIGRRLDALENS